jgi:hypothetical protein
LAVLATSMTKRKRFYPLLSVFVLSEEMNLGLRSQIDALSTALAWEVYKGMDHNFRRASRKHKLDEMFFKIVNLNS